MDEKGDFKYAKVSNPNKNTNASENGEEMEGNDEIDEKQVVVDNPAPKIEQANAEIEEKKEELDQETKAGTIEVEDEIKGN